MKILRGVIIVLLSTTSLWSATNGSIEIVMSIQTLKVDLTGGSLDVVISIGQNNVLDRAILRNNGNGLQDYALTVASQVGTWQRVNGVPGIDQFSIWAIWHQRNLKPLSSEFQQNDVLTLGSKVSSRTIFFNDNETHDVTDSLGNSVPPLADRSLFFWVRGPTNVTGSAAPNTVRMSVTALAAN